jgi:hypothetical protein
VTMDTGHLRVPREHRPKVCQEQDCRYGIRRSGINADGTYDLFATNEVLFVHESAGTVMVLLIPDETLADADYNLWAEYVVPWIIAQHAEGSVA